MPKNKHFSEEEAAFDNPEENGDTGSAAAMDTEYINDDDVALDEGGTLADKLKALREKLKACQQEKIELFTKLQRAQADFINLRKRDEEEKRQFVQFAKAETLTDIIPILLTFERALAHKGEEAASGWQRGIEQLYAQLVGVLERHGLEREGEVGEKFNPNLHETLGTIPTEEKERDQTVAEVLESGFSLSGKTLRPAKVRIFEHN